MWNYEFIKEVVIMSAFMFIIMLDIWGIGYWIVKLVKWIWKKLHLSFLSSDIVRSLFI